jgi:hypothetical protein
MSSFTYRCSVLAIALLCTMTGCHKNEHYCPGAPLDNCNYIDASTACTSNDDCSEPEAVCDLAGTMMCVHCIAPDQTSACTGTTPACGDDHTCRGCISHADCPGSNTCLPDGSCADPGQVAYVQQGGTGTPPCARGAPCGTLQQGVDSSRPYIKISGPGTLADNATTTIDGKAVTILADPGAKLDRTGDGRILLVRSAGANASIYDLEITGQTGPTDEAIQLEPNGGAPTLLLSRVKITGGQGRGISTTGGILMVSQSTISGNGGGISVMNGTFVIVGNVFYLNGTGGALLGGVVISAPANAPNRLEFNSFNQNATANGVAPAIQCTVAGMFTARNNIMSDNGTLTNMNQTGGNCVHAYSIARPGTVPPGTGNSNMDPLFVNMTTGDLHLRAGSPALGAADPNTVLTGLAERDIDGDVRTAPADIGADEVP